jgi:hypothetical protein
MDILMAEPAKKSGWFLRPGRWLGLLLAVTVVSSLTGLILHFGRTAGSDLPLDRQNFSQVNPGSSLAKGQSRSPKAAVADIFRVLKRLFAGQQISLVAASRLSLLTAAEGYARFAKAQVYISNELQDLEIPPFKISAYTGPGIARGFELMLRSNGVVVLKRRPNSVLLVSDGKTPIPPAKANPELRAKAESGNGEAQFELAKWYYQHKPSTSANRIEACKWAVLADHSGSSNAASLVKELDSFVQPQEMANGKAAAAESLQTKKRPSSPL